MHLITGVAVPSAEQLLRQTLTTDRQTLAKRRWRARSDDGLDFGFDLAEPLRHGDIFFANATHRYHIVQRAEMVLAIPLSSPLIAARIGWQIGNLHFPVSFEGDAVLAENDSAIRQLLTRENIVFAERLAVFSPLAAVTGGGHHHSHSSDHSHHH